MSRIEIRSKTYSFVAELFDTPAAEKIYNNLPILGKANLWGNEIYFSIPLHIPREPDARESVDPGEIGYWPSGSAFCIFFGPTPASSGDKPQAYSPVNVFGKIIGDLTPLNHIKPGDKVEVIQYSK